MPDEFEMKEWAEWENYEPPISIVCSLGLWKRNEYYQVVLKNTKEYQRTLKDSEVNRMKVKEIKNRKEIAMEKERVNVWVMVKGVGI